MNYGSHNETSSQLPTSGEGAREVYAELANGLHAMAQPLTILRGALGAMSLAAPCVSSQDRYLEMSNKQMDRLCDMMSGLQGLLDAALFEVQCRATDVWEAVEPAVEEVGASLQDSGIRIETTRPDRPVSAVADAARLEQSVRAALKTAASLSHRDDVLQLEILEQDDAAEVRVQAGSARGKRLGSPDRLSLALVEANTRSQRGTYQCTEDPLCISVRLPLQPREAGDPEIPFPLSDCPEPRHTGAAPALGCRSALA